MKSLTGKYFIVGVRYEKTLEDGTNAKTTEQYVVDALSWSECEAKTTEEMAAYTNGDMEIVTMKKAGLYRVIPLRRHVRMLMRLWVRL